MTGCDHLPDLLIASDERVECPSCGAIWERVVIDEYVNASDTPFEMPLGEGDTDSERLAKEHGWPCASL